MEKGERREENGEKRNSWRGFVDPRSLHSTHAKQKAVFAMFCKRVHAERTLTRNFAEIHICCT